MSKALRLYVTGLVGVAALALLTTGLVVSIDPRIALQFDADPGSASAGEVVAGLIFWTAATLLASALPIQISDGVQFAASTAPLMATAELMRNQGWVASDQ